MVIRLRMIGPLFLLVLTALITGCTTIRGAPQAYQPTDKVVEAINLTPEDIAQLAASISIDERNRLQNKAISVIDANYHQFVRDLLANRQDSSAAVSGVILMSSLAGVLAGSAAAKSNFALFNAGVVGAFGIVDKSYYYDKTVPALLAGMTSARASALLLIKSRQASSIEKYNGIDAKEDIQVYFDAGSLEVAIVSLTKNSEDATQITLEKIRTLEVPSDELIVRKTRIRDAIWTINDNTLAKSKPILAALNITNKDTAADTKLSLLKLLREGSPSQIDILQSQLENAGFLNK
jgi:hypothetical protein